jgi:hypothetical protein
VAGSIISTIAGLAFSPAAEVSWEVVVQPFTSASSVVKLML